MKSAAKSTSDAEHIVTEVSKIVHAKAGIQLGDKQKTMVQSRVAKRMIELNIADTDSYLSYLSQNLEKETEALVSLLTTHHTYFFREFEHFRYLEANALPEIIKKVRSSGRKKIRIWSAACSRGHEVYTISMFLSHTLARLAPELSYEILGTDIDPASVAVARNGVYHWNELKSAPSVYLGNHWARGTAEISDYAKAKLSIKEPCKFEVGNLFQLGSIAKAHEPFDIIFCRNVFIYFNPTQIKEVTSQLLRMLAPHGYLFIGLSESIRGLGTASDCVGPSIFRHPAPQIAPAQQTERNAPSKVIPIPVAKPSEILRVLCVDDSPVIIKVLEKILQRSQGFEIVATAANGVEAAEVLKKTKVDLMTLDIHMPVQTGLEYLRANFGPNHPPVVMISSVSREDAELAIKCLDAGASDYIEKPALANLKERADEIRAKLWMVHQSKAPSQSNSLAKSFAKSASISDADKKIRVILASPGDKAKIEWLCKQWTPTQPPVLVLFHRDTALVPQLATETSKSLSRKVDFFGGAEDFLKTPLRSGSITFCDASKGLGTHSSRFQKPTCSLLALGSPSKEAVDLLIKSKEAQVLVEQSIPGVSATDLTPYTSFGYLSDEFLAKAKVPNG